MFHRQEPYPVLNEAYPHFIDQWTARAAAVPEVIPKKSIDIDTQLSDSTVATTEGDRNRITHYILGHSSHKKMAATSAVVDGMPKYSKFNTWCTSCQKGKMHVNLHTQSLWQERAEHKNDV